MSVSRLNLYCFFFILGWMLGMEESASESLIMPRMLRRKPRTSYMKPTILRAPSLSEVIPIWQFVYKLPNRDGSSNIHSNPNPAVRDPMKSSSKLGCPIRENILNVLYVSDTMRVKFVHGKATAKRWLMARTSLILEYVDMQNWPFSRISSTGVKIRT
jgi:hypothetical protein